MSHRYCLDREAAQQKLWREEARWVAEQIARGKLSAEVSFPYAWSNRRASADVVMLNALLRPDITDLVRLSLRHGMPELQRGLEILKAEESLTGRRLALTQRILDSIELGIAQPIPPELLKRARDLCAGMCVDLDKRLDKHDD